MTHNLSNRAVQLANELLKRQRKFRRTPAGVNQRAVEKAIISYMDLCKPLGTAWRDAGKPLGEIAKWCSANNWPPLNALAVNHKTHEPSEEYNGAGGFQLDEWCLDVRKCIAFAGYPKKV